MSQLYVIKPVRLKFIPSEYRHPATTIQRWSWSESCKDISGNIKAAIMSDPSEGLRILIEEARDLIKGSIGTNGLEYGDFELVYSTDLVVDGRAWMSSHVISTHTLG